MLPSSRGLRQLQLVSTATGIVLKDPPSEPKVFVDNEHFHAELVNITRLHMCCVCLTPTYTHIQPRIIINSNVSKCNHMTILAYDYTSKCNHMTILACASDASHGARGKFEMAKLEVLVRQRHAVLRLSVHESASKVNRSGGDAQVIYCHRYLVVFHPFVE